MYDKPGVYLMLCRDIKNAGKFYVLDVQESEKVRTHAASSQNIVCWAKGCQGVGVLAVAVSYMEKSTEADRKKVTAYIRSIYDVPCK
jgi:hypothetical protein